MWRGGGATLPTLRVPLSQLGGMGDFRIWGKASEAFIYRSFPTWLGLTDKAGQWFFSAGCITKLNMHLSMQMQEHCVLVLGGKVIIKIKD